MSAAADNTDTNKVASFPSTVVLSPSERRMLRTRREQLGMTQSDVAAEAGCTWVMVNFVENGKRSPSYGLLCAIATALKLQCTVILR